MKKKLFLLFLACAFSVTLFTGCSYSLEDEDWVGNISYYVWRSFFNDSEMKNIDRTHKEAFESAFNDIEIFGARLCVPMKVSELPDKFTLSISGSEYDPISKNNRVNGRDIGAGLVRISNLYLYYDGEIKAAKAYVIRKEGQSFGEGIIYELEFDLLNVQPAFLGGQVDIRSDMVEIKNFLGEGNEFYEKSEYSDTDFCTLCYTDGNRMIELSYGIKGDDVTFFTGSVRTYDEL